MYVGEDQCFFFFKQKTAYEMRISDWSSDVCSSDLPIGTRVPIELIRNGKRMTVTAVVGERPSEQKLAESLGGDFSEEGAPADNDQAAQAGLGISLQTLTPQIASQLRVPETTKGVVIGAVNPTKIGSTHD